MTTIKNLYKALFILSAIFVMVFSVAGIASADFYQGSCQGGNCGGPICDSLGGGRRDLGQITYGGFTCSGTNYERQVGYYTGVAGINGWADKVWCYVNEISEDCATSGKVCSSTGCVTNTPTPTPTPNIACATNSQCGTNSLTGGLFCQGNNVYQNYITYTCNNPGTASSSCTNSTTPQLQTTCSGTQICTNGSCTNNCTSNYQQRCQGNNLYWYDSCGNQQNFIQYCPNGCNGNSCQNYINTCTYHSYERCNGNNLYWYDSCGTQQDLVQYCTNGCYNNTCQNYNNYNYNYNSNYGNCTYHAYKLCTGNNIYWYDSCGTQQDLVQYCTNGQVCQYGQCVANVQPYIQPIVNYVAHYRTACYGASLYWYDSLGAASGLYKNCQDSNSCTIDSCSAGKCLNTIKCDGSTCASGSADYNTYCLTTQTGSQNHCGNGLCEPNLGETIASCPNDCKINTAANGLSVSFFTKQDPASTQWNKTAQVGSNSQIYFMISVANNSTAEIDSVNVSANIPADISSLGNLQINGVAVSGDIVSGINIGSVATGTTKMITFEGKTQTLSTSGTKQATATVSISGNTQSDTVSIDLNAAQVAGASISSTQSTSDFWGFLKRWYLWILVAIVLIFIFIVVFRRLSSEA